MMTTKNPGPAPGEVADTLWQYYAGPHTASPELEDLHALAEQFIELKQHLGHRYHLDGGYVRAFLRFAEGQGVHRATELTPDVMRTWAASRDHLHPTTWTREVSALSVFLDHLKTLGKISNNPCLFLRRRPTSDFRPYVFTTDELRQIFGLLETTGPVRDRALVYLFLYACGLRVSEGAHLELRHLDLERGTVFIVKTKFNKERLLPLHPRVLGRLRHYRDEQRSGATSKAPLFVNAAGHRHDPSHLSTHFQQDLTRLGLYRPTQEVDGRRYGSPRLHSLRHSFAVHRLLRWYREGADVQAKLPLLSTYLGHSHIEYTQVYLKITGLLLREGHKRFSAHWEPEFPLEP